MRAVIMSEPQRYRLTAPFGITSQSSEQREWGRKAAVTSTQSCDRPFDTGRTMPRWIASHVWQANLAKFLRSSVGPSCGQSLQLIRGRRRVDSFATRSATLKPSNRARYKLGIDAEIARERASALAEGTAIISRYFGDSDVGWGTWIRTRTNGVRVRGSTVNLFSRRRANRGG